jgi:hypothetical protein
VVNCCLQYKEADEPHVQVSTNCASHSTPNSVIDKQKKKKKKKKKRDSVAVII